MITRTKFFILATTVTFLTSPILAMEEELEKNKTPLLQQKSLEWTNSMLLLLEEEKKSYETRAETELYHQTKAYYIKESIPPSYASYISRTYCPAKDESEDIGSIQPVNKNQADKEFD